MPHVSVLIVSPGRLAELNRTALDSKSCIIECLEPTDLVICVGSYYNERLLEKINNTSLADSYFKLTAFLDESFIWSLALERVILSKKQEQVNFIYSIYEEI